MSRRPRTRKRPREEHTASQSYDNTATSTTTNTSAEATEAADLVSARPTRRPRRWDDQVSQTWDMVSELGLKFDQIIEKLAALVWRT